MTVSAPAGARGTAASNVPWAAWSKGAAAPGRAPRGLSSRRRVVPPAPARCLVAGQALGDRAIERLQLSVDPLDACSRSAGRCRIGVDRVSGGGTCAWTATSGAPWITLTGRPRT